MMSEANKGGVSNPNVSIAESERQWYRYITYEETIMVAQLTQPELEKEIQRCDEETEGAVLIVPLTEDDH